MTSERVQRQIGDLLTQAEEAVTKEDWATVAARSRAVLRLDSTNADAKAYLEAARPSESSAAPEVPHPSRASTRQPTSFASGCYEVRSFLGEGGKKRVYLCYDQRLDRDVAFSLIKTEGLDDVGVARVRQEAQAMGRLGGHGNIVTIHDIGEEDGQLSFVSELMAGWDIEGLIDRAENHQLSLDQAVRVATEVSHALEHAHTLGIIHRDVKPGNVWLTADGVAKLGDFGLAVALDRSRLTQAGMMVGTVSYMPPEQATGGEVGPRSDLYSLGAMLYEMVTGRPPFVGDESVAIIGQHLNTSPVAPTWHRPDCPPALETLILRLLEKDASKRPATAAEVREALAAINLRRRQSALRVPASTPPFIRDLRRTRAGAAPGTRRLRQRPLRPGLAPHGRRRARHR